jgi:hypothetical protein
VSSLQEQIACIKREIALRVNTYPKWVRAGRMKEHNADREISVMRDVLATLFEVEKQHETSPEQPAPPAGQAIASLE